MSRENAFRTEQVAPRVCAKGRQLASLGQLAERAKSVNGRACPGRMLYGMEPRRMCHGQICFETSSPFCLQGSAARRASMSARLLARRMRRTSTEPSSGPPSAMNPYAAALSGAIRALRTAFFEPRRPLPETSDDLVRESLAEFARHEEDLAAVMCFVRNGIGHEESDVAGPCTPDEPARHLRKLASVPKTSLEHVKNPGAATAEGLGHHARCRRGSRNKRWRRDVRTHREALHPAASAVVEMSRNAPHGATRRAAERRTPELRRDVFDQVRGDAVVDAPSIEEHVLFCAHIVGTIPEVLAPNDIEANSEMEWRRPVSPTQSEDPLQRESGLEAQKGDRP